MSARGDQERRRVADELEVRGALTADPHYDRAAAVLRKRPRGRPRIDDAVPLLEISVLVAQGVNSGEAARRVLKQMRDQHSDTATLVRLRRKRRENREPSANENTERLCSFPAQSEALNMHELRGLRMAFGRAAKVAVAVDQIEAAEPAPIVPPLRDVHPKYAVAWDAWWANQVRTAELQAQLAALREEAFAPPTPSNFGIEARKISDEMTALRESAGGLLRRMEYEKLIGSKAVCAAVRDRYNAAAQSLFDAQCGAAAAIDAMNVILAGFIPSQATPLFLPVLDGTGNLHPKRNPAISRVMLAALRAGSAAGEMPPAPDEAMRIPQVSPLEFQRAAEAGVPLTLPPIKGAEGD